MYLIKFNRCRITLIVTFALLTTILPLVHADIPFSDNLLLSNETAITSNQNHPALAVGKNGVVHATWYDSRSQINSCDIYYSKSTDNGLTFGTSVKINGDMGCSYNTSQRTTIYVTDNTVYVAWTTDKLGNPDICLVKSTDEGDTWSTPVIINSNGGEAQTEPTIVCANTNTIFAVWLSFNWSDPQIPRTNVIFSRSNNGGTSWVEKIINDKNASLPYDFGKYPSMVLSDSGVLYITYSYNFAHIIIHKSIDNGEHWTKSVEVYGPNYTGGGNVYTPAIACWGNRIFVAWEGDGVPINETRKDGIFLSMSDDHSTTWTAPKLINKNYSCPWRPSEDTTKSSSNVQIETDLMEKATRLYGDTAQVRLAVDRNGNPLITWSGRDDSWNGDSIYLSYSPDRGYNWNGDNRVNDAPTNDIWYGSNGYSSIGLDQFSNILYVAWDDYRNNSTSSIFVSFFQLPIAASVDVSFSTIPLPAYNISWSGSTAPDFLKYEIYFSLDNQFNKNTIFTILDKNQTTFSITNLSVTDVKYFKVRTYYTNGFYIDSDITVVQSEIDGYGWFGNNIILWWGFIFTLLCLSPLIIILYKIRRRKNA
ncbi:MAG: sialidase family protein [Methanobacteriota archaeon]